MQDLGSLIRLDWMLAGNPLRTWLMAVVVALITYAALHLIRSGVMRHLRALTRRTRNVVDDVAYEVLDRTRVFFLLFVSLYAGSRVLVFGTQIGRAIEIVAVVIIMLQAAFWGEAAIRGVISRRVTTAIEEDAASVTTLNALGFISRLVLWSVLILLGLANLGIEIGPLLAGLGVGGIAVALALQNVLGDLFASLSIVLDKPFVVGDFKIGRAHV